MQLQTYVAIADYKAQTKGQINLREDDLVDVIDKNTNGITAMVAPTTALASRYEFSQQFSIFMSG